MAVSSAEPGSLPLWPDVEEESPPKFTEFWHYGPLRLSATGARASRCLVDLQDMQRVLQGSGFLVMRTLFLLAGGFEWLSGNLNFVTRPNVQCIRNSMASKQECPVCRKSANEGQIRPSVALEEIIESWKAARYAIPLVNCSRTR